MKFLSGEQTTQFLRDGYIVVKEAFPREVAEELVGQFWAEAPIAPNDRAAWEQRIYLIQKGFSPREGGPLWGESAFLALDDLLGEGRYNKPNGSGWPLLNLPGFATPPWTPPTEGWHIDGIQFHHHVNSKDQGLIGLLLFTDVAPGGGGTAVKPGSHHFCSRILQEAEPDGFEVSELARVVGDATMDLPAIEILGNAGDILMMHPHLYHASSPNCSDTVRIASNFCVTLHEPMNLNQPDPAAYSLVEKAIVQALSALW